MTAPRRNVSLRNAPATVRFWAKVDKRGPLPKHCRHLGRCWKWMGADNPEGYGRFNGGKERGFRMVQAHSFALQENLGRPLRRGMVACHHCDNPNCVNPAHLFEGTRLENDHDSMRKGRRPTVANGKHGSLTCPERVARGERNGMAKLTDSDVRRIRRLVSEGKTQASLAREHGVDKALVGRIVHRQVWRHI